MRVVNTFQAQTPIGQSIQNLSTALFSGPGPIEREQAQADMEYRRALADRQRQEYDLADSEARARKGIAGLFEGLGGAAFDPAAVSRATALAAQGGYDPQNLGELFRTYSANAGLDDDAVIRSMAGAGNAIGVNEAVSLSGQDRVRDANAANALRQATTVAEIGNAGAMERLIYDMANKPVELSPGETAYLPPSHALAGSGPLVGQPSLSSAQGRAFEALPSESQSAAVGPTREEGLGQLLMSLAPEFTDRDQRVAIGVQNQPDMRLVVGEDGNTYTLDTSDPTGIVSALPARGLDEQGNVALIPFNLEGYMGTDPSVDLTAARRNLEAEAQSLGIAPAELDFLRRVDQMMRGTLIGFAGLPAEVQDEYLRIMEQKVLPRIASQGQPAISTGAALPEGYQVIE